MCRPRAFDHDTALALWHLGFKHPLIARKLNANPGTLRQMVRRMRERGDERAVRRYRVDGAKKTESEARLARGA